MNKHYDLYLTRKYAPLYRERNMSMNETAMCWGFAVGDGWFNIINNLSMSLCKDWLEQKHNYDYMVSRLGMLKLSKLPESEFNPIVTSEMVNEIKLELDCQADKVPSAVQVKEKFGSLRFYVNSATDEQYAMIGLAETLSAHTCEVCGARGKTISIGGLYTTLCKFHAQLSKKTKR